jgi:hypothetical protein
MPNHQNVADRLTDVQRADVLGAFRRVLGQEAHILRREAGLLWQQLYNRLQWKDGPVSAVLEPVLERRIGQGVAPWLRTRTPFRESQALIRTLVGHSESVEACAWSPEEGRVLSGSSNTLKVWDAETGECIATLQLGGPVCHHPYRASAACGDALGSIYLVDLVGMTMGAVVVTAVDLGAGATIRCPVCFEQYPLRKRWLGREIDCPGKTCDARLKVNPFVVKGKWRWKLGRWLRRLWLW